MTPAMMTFLTAVIALFPRIIQLGENLLPFVEILIKNWGKTNDPTQADWDALHLLEQNLRDDIQKSIDSPDAPVV